MRAVRDSEVASQSIGLDPTLIRTVAFALSAAVAGLAGGVFAAMSDFISPESFPFFQSILFLLVVMIGGADRVLGPLIGALVVVLLPELLSWLAQYRLLFVGVLLLVVLRLAPDGFVGLVGRFLVKPGEGRPAEAKRDVTAMLAGAAGRGRLAVEDLSVSFGGVKAVVDLSFAAEPGRITSIIGPNGAGKSTVLNLACGFYRPDRGSIRLAGREIAGLASHQVARAGIARTYQTTQLFARHERDRQRAGGPAARPPCRLPSCCSPSATRSARRWPKACWPSSATPVPSSTWPARCRTSTSAWSRSPARSPLRPSVLVLDEPAAGLDPGDTRRLGELLRKVAATGVAVVLVEHDMRPRHERLRPRRGARCRPEDRRGRARRGRPRARGCSRPISASSGTPRATASSRWRPAAAPACSPPSG